jgi:hypothetical protein
MAECYEVAHHLFRCLESAKGLTDVTFEVADFGPFVTGKSQKGQFYIQLYADPGGAFKAVQALSLPSGSNPKTLGYWQPLGGQEGSVSQVVKAIWKQMVEQEQENIEKEWSEWVPIAHLPRTKWVAPPARVVPSIHEDTSDTETRQADDASPKKAQSPASPKVGVANIRASDVPVPEVSTPEEPDGGILGMFGI